MSITALGEDKSDDWDPALLAALDPPCRLCGSRGMRGVFDLGHQAIGSYFPKPGEKVPVEPLRLMYCSRCSLAQLSEGCDHAAIYSSGRYGYRSGQNPQMVEHLRRKAEKLTRYARLGACDIVCDIGSNDGTFLGQFHGPERIGFDPTARQFAEFYPPATEVVDELFSAARYRATNRPAKLITSLACLYDLADPVDFARQVAACLADDGIWHFEQHHLPAMLAAGDYSAICHEHLTYFSLESVAAMLRRAGMYVADVEYNDANGGSFAVTARKEKPWSDGAGHHLPATDPHSAPAHDAGLERFAAAAKSHRDELVSLVRSLNRLGRVSALGASTKGNTLLQFCGFGPQDLRAVGEINPDKIGCVTPGSQIPIVAEADVWGDYLLVLPWHYRESIIERARGHVAHLIFPFPQIELVYVA